jgi:two-component system, OmpR family, KDP operon response regulator KdpE
MNRFPTFRILIVDDEPEIRRFLRASLNAQHHEIVEAVNGSEALVHVRTSQPDLMILDLGLPDIDGIEVARRVRGWSHIPIIILSVRNQETDKIEALDVGADDYLTKPFGVGELMARVRGVMRRAGNLGSGPVYQEGAIILDTTRRLVTVSGREVALTPTEFDILAVLLQNAGKVITHRQLIHRVWGTAFEDESRLLRVNISNLRKKIETNPNHPVYLLTELGIGYRFNPDT